MVAALAPVLGALLAASLLAAVPGASSLASGALSTGSAATVTLLAACGACCAAGLAALAVVRRRLERVARAEHELRGPATAMALACSRMRRTSGLARHAEALEAQLARLDAGLADLEAARTGRRASQALEPAELRSATSAALAPWDLEPGGGGFEWLGGPAPVTIDRRRLATTLGNLMANAVEHGDGDLRVRGRTTPSSVRIEIRNRNRARGPAPPAHGRSRGTDLPGSSLGRGRGLRIAGQAARELGGRLLVEVGERETVAVLELPRGTGGDENVAA